MREPESNFIRNEVTKNKYIWLALFLSFLLIFAGVCVPGLSTILSLTIPDPQGIAIIFIMSLGPLIIIQIFKPLEKKLANKLIR